MDCKTRPHRQMPAALRAASRRQTLLGLGAAVVAAGAPLPGSSQEWRRLHFLIPAAAGGGWDQTARAVAESLTRTHLVDSVTFEHLSGEGGGRAIAYLVATAERQQNTLMVSSTPIVLRAVRRTAPDTYRDLTPIAALIGDYAAIAVRADSPYKDFAALAKAMRRDPAGIRVAGGSVRGGMDHLVAARAFSASAGVDPRSLVYYPYDAGGEALDALLAGQTQVLATGLGELLTTQHRGDIRILAMSAPEGLPDAPGIPTFVELGHDLTFVNWRGFFGPPHLPAAIADAHEAVLADLNRSPEWAEVRKRHAWQPLYHPGAEFAAFLAEQEAMARRVLASLALI